MKCSGDPVSLLSDEFLRVVASDTAEELARFRPGNAVDELDTTGEGLVGDFVVCDVFGNDILQLGLFPRVLSDESGGLLLGDDESEGQLPVELVGHTDDADVRNERVLAQVGLHLCGSDLETADLQHLLETIDDEYFHVLVDRDLVTGTDPTVDKGFFGGLFVVTVSRSHRMGLDDQLAGLVEAGEGTVGPLYTSNNSWQENTSGDTRLVTSFDASLHPDHTSLRETVGLEDGGLGKESDELLESFVGEGSGTAEDGAKT